MDSNLDEHEADTGPEASDELLPTGLIAERNAEKLEQLAREIELQRQVRQDEEAVSMSSVTSTTPRSLTPKPASSLADVYAEKLGELDDEWQKLSRDQTHLQQRCSPVRVKGSMRTIDPDTGMYETAWIDGTISRWTSACREERAQILLNAWRVLENYDEIYRAYEGAILDEGRIMEVKLPRLLPKPDDVRHGRIPKVN